MAIWTNQRRASLNERENLRHLSKRLQTLFFSRWLLLRLLRRLLNTLAATCIV